MNENTRPQKRRRSFLWLWILLLLAAFTGGIVLGLKLNTLPLPNDVQNRLYPVLEAIIPGSTAVRPQEGAPVVTPAPAVETPAPVMETPAPVVETPAPEVETLLPAIPAVAENEAPVIAEEPVKAEPAYTAEASGVTIGDEERFESAPAKNIGIDAALSAALAHAKVEEKDAKVTGVFRTMDEAGQPVYEVGFLVGEISYEYLISAADAEILGWKMSGFHAADEETFGAEPVQMLDEQRAKALAFEDAGVKEAEVRNAVIQLGTENGADCYTLRFETPAGSFRYQLDAFTGEILSAEKPE